MSKADVLEHYWESVPGWAAFKDLYFRVVRDHPADKPGVFVEVGSWLGKSASLMGVEIHNSNKRIQFYCVDPWTDGGPDLKGTPYYKGLQEPVWTLFQRNTKPVSHIVNPMRATSLEAVAWFQDGTIDFLMLDGDHSYEVVSKEIQAYLPKMKPGGIISGDDYLWPGVKQAVDEAFKGKAHTVILKEHKNARNSVSYWLVTV